MKSSYLLKVFGVVTLVSIIIALFYSHLIGHNKSESIVYFFVNSAIMTFGIWAGCVGIVYLLWKHLPWERHPIKHLVIETIGISAYVIFFGYLRIVVGHWLHIPNEFAEGTIPRLVDFTVILLITYLITAIHEAIFFYRQWVINFSKSARLEKDNIEAKYATLISQINPHFLFNSLNSLSLLVDNNKQAVDYIDNLSDVMRYILKSNENELVLLRDEKILLDKYLQLQKNRFNENLIINIDVKEEYFHYQLPPLSVQMLVENCIKHNIITEESPLKIDIIANQAQLMVKNNLQRKSDVNSTGQGLKNITERFAFFTHIKPLISEANDSFTVTIPLLTVSV